MLLSAVSILVVAQSIFEIPEGLMNNPVYGTYDGKYECKYIVPNIVPNPEEERDHLEDLSLYGFITL